jgi:hypothetical protein
MMTEGMDEDLARELLNLFFPTRQSRPDEIHAAKDICYDCPVRMDCLAYSILNWEKVGIWGGETEQERRVTRRTMRVAIGREASHERAVSWLSLRSSSRVGYGRAS